MQQAPSSSVLDRLLDVKLPSTQYGTAFWMKTLKPPYSLMLQMPSTRLTGSRPCTTSDICALLYQTFLINSYRSHTELYIDGDVIYSQEGTTQGDPMAMPMYAIATVPLISKLTSSTKQTWYADDRRCCDGEDYQSTPMVGPDSFPGAKLRLFCKRLQDSPNQSTSQWPLLFLKARM